MDRENVIKGKEHLDAIMEVATHLVYPDYVVVQEHCLALLAMLKEHDAVEPRVSTAEQRCGHCNKVIEMDGWQSCPWCGKRIDWEGWWKKNGTRNQDT